MADPLFITQLDETTTFNDSDYGINESTPGGTPETHYIKRENILAQYLKRINYQISRTVSGGNVTFALKDSDGNDASATKPLTFVIAGTLRKLTSALSLQVNASTNTWNLGATEFANLPQELFIYVGWRASTSTIFLLVSRLPGHREYADVSTTATSERYGAITGAAPVATDPLALIGRVNVQNTGTAAFSWSIPAANIIVHRPIYETSILSYVPNWTSTGTPPAIGNGSITGRYVVRYKRFLVHGQLSIGSTTTLGTGTYFLSMPFINLNDVTVPGFGAIYDASVDTIYTANANFNANVNSVRIRSHGTAGLISGTVPIALANGDAIYFGGEPALP